MLLLEQLSLFSRVYSWGKLIGSLPFQWNRSRLKLQPVKSTSIKRSLSLKSGAHFLFLAILFGQAIFQPEDINLTTTGKLLTSLGLVVNIFYGSHLQISRAAQNEIVAFINSVLQLASMEKNQRKSKGKKVMDKINILLAHNIYMGLIAFSFVFPVGLHFRNVCKPSFAGYWLLPECSGHCHQTIFASVLKICLSILNWWLTSLALSAGAFLLCNLQILCVFTLKDLLAR